MSEMRYYDHAKNSRRAAVGHAMAAARRDALAVGDAWRVEFTAADGVRCWWSGCAYDVCQLAGELRRNDRDGSRAVVLINPAGRVVEP